MKSKTLILLFFYFCYWISFSQQDIASIDLVDFNNSVNYGPGSGVTVHFNPKGIYNFNNEAGDNQFFLELSDSDGTFPASPIILSTVDGFFTTTINGVIPNNSSGNYRLRIRASKGLLSYDTTVDPEIPVYGEVSVESGLFTVTGTSILSPVNAYSRITPNNSRFDCTVEDNFDNDPIFGSLTLSSGDTSGILGSSLQRRIIISNFNTNSSYTVRKIDAINDITENLGSVSQTQEYYVIPDDIGIGTYNYEIQELDVSGRSSIYTVVLILHRSTTTLGNDSSELVCVDTDVIFNIDISSSGIGENYRGSYYDFDYGDGSDIEIFTHAEILANDQLIHRYQNPSCAIDPSFFELKKRMYNKYNSSSGESCSYQQLGNGVIKLVNTSKAPEALIESSDICENQDLVVINSTTLGEYGLTVNCDNDADFTWDITDPSGTLTTIYIEGDDIEDEFGWLNDFNSDGILDIVIPSTTVEPGCWSFTLKAVNQNLCGTISESSETVNVDAIADADFEFLDENDQIINEICFGQPVTFENTSNVLDYDCQNPNYTWTILPNNGYNFVNPFTENSQSPDVIFDVPGVYNVTLTVSNICGESFITKPITILGDPTVDFTNPSLAVCENINEFNTNGYTLDFSNPSIAPTYSSTPYEPTTFIWTVIGGDEGIDYTFDSTFGQNTQFPIINFSSFGDYVISVQVNGNCTGSNNADFSFAYAQTPIIENTDLLQELCSGDPTQEVVYNSDMPLTTYSYTVTADAEISGYEGIDFSNGIPVMNLINSPPSNVTNSLIITVTPTVVNCTGNPIDFIFTVNPTPVIPSQTTAICSEDTFVINPINAPPNTIVPSGTTYVWTVIDNPNVIGETSESSPQADISQELINTTNTVQTVIYTIIPTSGADGSCEGDPFTVTVDINPKPSVEDIIPPAICSGNSFSETPTNGGGVSGADIVPSGTTYTWTVVNSSGEVTGDSAQSTPQTSIGQTLTNTSNIPQTVVYTVIPTSGDQGNCEGDPFTVTVTVNPTPVIPNQTTSICSEETFVINPINAPPNTIVPSGTTYVWTVTDNPNVIGETSESSPQAEISQQLINITNTVQTVIYTVTPTSGVDGSCVGAEFTVTVDVNPKPSVEDITPPAICSGNSFSETPTNGGGVSGADIVPTGTTYTWTVVDSSGEVTGDSAQPTPQTSIGQTLTNTSNIPQTVVYTVIPTSGVQGNCKGNSFTVTVTVNPEPVVEDQITDVCSNEALGYTISGDVDTPLVATYNLTSIVSTGLVGASGNQVVADGISSGALATDVWTNDTPSDVEVVYTLVPVGDNGCKGNSFTVTVTVNPEPVVEDQITDVCSNEALGYTISGDVDTPLVATYNLTSIVSTGLVGASGNQVVADGILSDALATDVWTNDTPSNIEVVYTLVPVGDNGCKGNSFTVTVTVNPEPVVANQPVEVCSDEPLGINFGSSSSVAATSYEITALTLNGLTVSAGGASEVGGLSASDLSDDAFTNITAFPVDVVYTVVPFTSVNCEGNSFTVTVTVNPEPVVEDQITEVCSNESLDINFGSSSSVAATSYEITALTLNGLTVSAGGASEGGGLSASDLFDDAFTNNTAFPVDVVYTVVPTGDNGCEGDPFTVTVTVNPEPVGTSSTESIISDVQFDFDLQNYISNGVTSDFFWQISSISGEVSGVNIGDSQNGDVSGTITNVSGSTVFIVYNIFYSSNPTGCFGDPFTLTLSIDSEPVVNNQSTEVCSDEPLGINFGSNSSVAATSYEITALTLNGLTVSAGGASEVGGLSASDLSDDAFTNITAFPVDVVYTVVPFNNITPGNSFTVTVTVNPEPVVEDQITDVCSNEALGYTISGDVDTPLVATYNLTSIVSTGLVGASGNQVVADGISSGALATDVWTNDTPSDVEVVYTLVPVGDNGCKGNSFTVTVTVNPEPVVEDQITDVCSNEALGYTISGDVDTPLVATYNLTSIVSTGLVGASGNQVVADGILSDALATDVWTNDTPSNIEVVYTLVPVGDNGCKGNSFTVTVTVNPEPVVANQPVEVCSDEPLGINFGSSSSVAATSYEITALTLNGLTVSAGGASEVGGLSASDLSDDAFTNITAFPVDVVYTVVPFTSVNCEGNSFTVTVTVNPEPVVEDQITEVCSNESLDINFGSSSSVAATSYEITALTLNGLTVSAGGASEGGGLSASDLFDDAFTNNTAFPVDVVYTVVPTGDNGCKGDPFTVTVTVNPEPVVEDQITDVCSNEALGYTISGDVDTPLVATYNLTSIVSTGLVGASGNQVVADGISSGALATDVWTNDTPSNIEVVYTLVPVGDNGCEGDPFTVTVTVNPEPVVANQPIEVCSDELLGINFGSSSSVAATSYEITVLTLNGLTVSAGGASVGGGLSASDLSDDAFTNITAFPVDVVYTVVPFTSANCEGNSFTVTVTVNPEPVVDNQTTEVCSDESLGYTISGDVDTPSVATYNLTSIVSTGLVGASGNQVVADGISSGALATDVWTNDTPSDVEVVYTLVPVGDNGCEGNSFTVTVTVNPEPVVDNQITDVCSDESLGYTISGDVDTPLVATYNLTSIVSTGLVGASGNQVVADGISSGALATDVWTNDTPSNIEVVYTLVPVGDNGCEGDPFTVTVTVNPEPVVANQPIEVCSDELLGINFGSSSSVAATSYEITVLTLNGLTVSAGGASVGGGLSASDLSDDAFTNITAFPVDVVYTVVPFTSANCEGDPFTVTVTVNPEPVVDNQTTEVCSDESLGYTISGDVDTPSVATYNLTSIVSTGLVGASGNQVVADGISSGALATDVWTNDTPSDVEVVYTLVPVGDNGCEGNSFTVTVTVNPEPVVDNQITDVCSDESLGYTISGDVDTPLVATYNLTSIVSTGLVGASGNQVVADGISSGALATDVWTNDTPSNIEVVYTLVPVGDNGCEGDPFTVTVTVNPTSEINPIVNQTICSQSVFQDVFVTSPTQPTTSITYTWEVTSAGPNLSGYTLNSGPIGITNPILGETIFNASNTAEDLVYTLTPNYDNCAGTPQIFTITVNPTPEIPDFNVTICSEETFDVLPENGLPTAATIIPANTTYTWTVLPNTSVVGQSDVTLPQSSISQTLTNNSNVTQDIVYVVTPTSSDGCEGASFELTVTVETRPIIDDKTAGICSGDTFLVAPTDNSPLEIVPANTLYTWTVLPGTDLSDLTGYNDQTSGVSSISQTLVNLTDESKTIVYEVTPTSGTCEGLPFEIEITISPRPFVDDIIVTPICSEDTFTVIPETATPSLNNIVPIGTTFTWTVVDNPNVIGDTDQVNPQSQISQTLTNTSSTIQTVVYTVVPSSAGCDGLPFTITVDVKPRPFIVSGPDTQDTQCSGDAFFISPQDGIPTPTTLVPAGTQYTWITAGNPNLLGWSDQTTAVNLISQTLENTTNQVQQIIYTIIPELDGCIGPSFDAVINIEPKPFVPDVIADICDATSYILSPQNGILPDVTTIIPDVTTYTWSVPSVTGGVTGGSSGTDEAFFDSGILDNPTTNIQTVVYTVTPNYYTLSNNTTPQCSGEPFTITITISPSPEINEVITNIACSYSDPLCGASIEISPLGIAPFRYNWVSIEGNPINDPTDEDQFDLCPGNYELTITDASSCSYVFQYEIVPPEPIDFTLITQTDISCNNVNTLPCDGSIEVSTTGGTLPYSLIEWYTETIPDSGVFDSGPLINVINPYNLVNACEGNYVLKILDANGCEFVSDVYIIEQAVEPIFLTETLSNYNGFNIDCNAANSGTITVNLSGGSGVFDYTFAEASGSVLDANTILSSPATLVFDFLTAGDYTLTVEDPNCTDQIVRNYTLTQPNELIITATLVDAVSCFGGLATYNVTATGGVPPYTGIGLQSVLGGPVTFIVSDTNGCEDDFSTVVNEPTELLATYVVVDAPCFGDTGQVTVTPTGGTGVLTVNLYDNNNLLITSLNTTQGNSVTYNQLAETYFYDVVDENNCSYGPEIVEIDEPNPIVIIDFEVIQPDCNTTPAWEFNNGSICITIQGGTNPFPIGTSWVNNGGGQWCLNNLSAGTYPIDVTDINNCPMQNPIPDITLVRPPEITAFFTDTLDINCDTNTATQINTIIINGGIPPYQVTWSGGIVDAANPFVMQTSVPGNYSAFVNDQYGITNGCPPIEFPLDPITFFEFGIADFTFSSNNSDFCGIYAINDPIQFNNISTGDIVSYTWNFGDGSPEFNGLDAPDHIYNATGIYTVSLTVEDLYGCFDTYSDDIEITKGYEIILPNAFSPNGDGINETIRPVTICMTEVQMSIYDTWGSLIYAETSDDIYGWDGTINGTPAENGNYIMVVKATAFNGSIIELNGPVTLIK